MNNLDFRGGALKTTLISQRQESLFWKTMMMMMIKYQGSCK